MNIRREKLPISALERIDVLCSAFEEKWQGDQPPSIESVLTHASSPREREALLAELLVLEIDYRRRRGEEPTAEEYDGRFPEHSETIREALRDGNQRPASSRFQTPMVARLAELFPSLEIIELIGAGGMGAVYKARQQGLDRIVALKVLPEELGHDVKFALRFTREARALARLNHPNIVSVFEFGHVEEIYYFLMEYVDGSTLREVVQSGQLKPEQALAIVPPLCDALQYAHDSGVVHRDIKPENILLSRDGQVKIADFGLSRVLGSEGSQDLLTGTHQVMGTPRYMAPEQLEGSHHVDHRADIYSLGVVIYEMLTGELPIGLFAAPSRKVQIDLRLDDVVLRTLEKDPERRYQRASQIKSDVESITSEHASEPAPTIDLEDAPARRSGDSRQSNLQQQEMAGRLLLLRRQLMERVQQSLRPLYWGQIAQMLFGVGFTAIGVHCWVNHQEQFHRIVSGAILHGYGILMILAAGMICMRIKRLDYLKPVGEVRDQLDRIGLSYLRYGGWLGLAWWLLWIPLAVAIGLDGVVYPIALWISLGVGTIGLAISILFYRKLLRSEDAFAQRWRRALSSESLRNAHRELDEITTAGVV
jgi:serine/threonine-protein kinase